jgi:hypothetical protein
MNREKFYEDLQTIYDELTRRDAILSSYYGIVEGRSIPEAERLVDEFCRHISVEPDGDMKMAALDRIVSLRENSLEEVLKRRGMDEEELVEKKELAYSFVSRFHTERFEDILVWITENGLLNRFYRDLMQGVHAVGMAMSGWQNSWTAHILHGVNRELFELFNGDEEKIYEMLYEKDLMQKRGDEVADRSYTVLVPGRDGYRKVSYAEAFNDEIREVETMLAALISDLEDAEDDVFGRKEEWLEYFRQIKRAFLHTEPDELVEYWADVDRAWMKIDTPVQVGHPLEYYEDRYRKSVALEWDLRIVNPTLQKSSSALSGMKSFASRMAVGFGLEGEKLYLRSLERIERTQLYIGRPALYYGAEFNGLFSAQVVPNDEVVSSEAGKKIFAYADFVRESRIAKPVMQISVESLGIESVLARKRLARENPELWYRIYDISTIGHEYGHILWMDEDTETAMNGRGQFKNIEEFKATCGGILSYFEDDADMETREAFVDDLISRAVSLMAWRGYGEVEPYYCEGLIHLELLYRSGMVDFDGIRVSVENGAYGEMKRLYEETYGELARHYLQKREAGEFLERFALKTDSHYMPVTEEVKRFVVAYCDRYAEIGQKIAEIGK